MTTIPEYPHQLAGHCGSGALRDLLEWASLGYGPEPMREGTVFGLGGDLSFRYLKGPGLGSSFYLVGRGADLTTRFCQRLGISHEVRSTNDPNLGWEWLRDEIDHGHPLLCWADMRELPYLNVRMQMSRHDIVVIGYNDSCTTVVDNDREFVQNVGNDELSRARNSTGFPVPTQNTCYPMRFPKTLPELLPTAASALRDSVRNMLDSNPPPFSDVRSSALVEASGLAGVDAFAEDVERWGEAADETQLTAAHLLLAVFIEKAGTGGGLFRRLQSDFLGELCGLAPDPAVTNAAARCRLLAEAWESVAREARLPTRSASDRHNSVVRAVQTLPGLERDAVAAMSAAADALAPATPSTTSRQSEF